MHTDTPPRPAGDRRAGTHPLRWVPALFVALAAGCQSPGPVAALGECSRQTLGHLDLITRGTDYNLYRIVAPGRADAYITGDDLAADGGFEPATRAPLGARLLRMNPPHDDVVFGTVVSDGRNKYLRVGQRDFLWGGRHFFAVLRSIDHLGREAALRQYAADPETAACAALLTPEIPISELVR